MKYLVCMLFSFAASAAQAQQPGLERLLSYDLADLMDVQVVSASKASEAASEAPATVRVITAEEIRERGYLTLEEALAGLPGFQFRDISGFNSYVFLRGLPSQNNLALLLVDGVQINELNSGGFYAGGQFNLANVKRIEVVYGPASALYGTNAISGVINIITNDPRDLQGGRASALAGGFDTGGMDMAYGWHDEAAGRGLSFSGMTRQTGKSPLGGAAGDGNWSANMENFEKDLALDGKFVFKDFTAGGVLQDKRASRTTNFKSAGTDYLDFGTDWHIRFGNAYLRHLYDREPGWTLESRLYYRESTVMDDTIASVYNAVCSTCGQQGQYRPNSLIGLESRLALRPADAVEITVGAAGEHERLAEDFSTVYSGDPLVRPAAPGRPRMLSEDLLSLYAQARADVAPGLRLTGGLRHDSSSGYGKVYTPRAALVYNREKLTLKLLYSEAFRAPRPWDFSYGSGNSGLDPEKLRSLEAACAYAVSGHLRADLSLYRNDLRGLLALENDRWVNHGNIETRGLEARLELAKGPLKTYLNYAYQDSWDESGARVAEIGLHSGGAGALYAFSRQVKLDLNLRYLGVRKNPSVIAATGGSKVGAAAVADATLSLLDLRGLNLRLMAKNFLGARYYHTSNRPPDRYRQPGRQFLLEAGFAFGL